MKSLLVFCGLLYIATGVADAAKKTTSNNGGQASLLRSNGGHGSSIQEERKQLEELAKGSKDNPNKTKPKKEKNKKTKTDRQSSDVDDDDEEAEEVAETKCDKKCQDAKTLHETLSFLEWRSDYEDSPRAQAYEKLEELLEAMGQNTDDLRENVENMRAKETSLANKTLGAVGMATVGIGGMMLAQGMAEKKADEDAELDMTAYLQTFRCEYGDGHSFQGGQSNIELPGGNALTTLYQEYKTLAADLKERKEALGLKPGLESKEILDKASIGLYDDVNTGKTGGAFTSIADALQGDDADAAAWAEQKEKSQNKLKTGAIVAGAGAVATMAANIAINGKSDKENSAEILARRDDIMDELREVIKKELKKCNDFIEEEQKWVKEHKNEFNEEDQKQYAATVEGLKKLDENGDISQLKGHFLCQN